VWISGAPGGIALPICNGLTPCRGTFLPLVGRRVAVGRIDGDAKADVAVVHDGPVTQSGKTISSLQVVVQRPGTWKFSDLTPSLTALGTDLSGQAVAAGRLSDTAGDTSIVAMARSSAVSGSALRVFRFVPGAQVTDLGTLEEITDTAIPAASPSERWQADTLRFDDADGDGFRDLVLLWASPPASGTALRILRAAHPAEGAVQFVATLADMLAVLGTPGERFEGACLAMGDLDSDGFPELIVSRAAPALSVVQTRAVRIDR
jgi:hypothetical protein